MRTTCLFVLLALSASVAVSAQPEGDPIPDPTPPHQYYPLAVGNVWEYANQGLLPLTEGYFLRREILRDTVIEGRTYFVEVRSRNDDDGMGWHSSRTTLVRFDSTSARPVQWGGTREGAFECSFRGDFGAAIVCWDETFPDGDTYVGGQVDAVIPFGGGGRGLPPPGEMEVAATKTFYPLGPADPGTLPYYAAPIGYAGETPGFCTGCRRNLTYARVRLDDGSVYEVGERYAVAADAAPEAGGLTLGGGPNPTAGALTLRLGGVAGEAVTLEAFDARGRQVWAREVLGQQPVSVDASGWAPGLYLVRARTGTEDVTTTIVRR